MARNPGREIATSEERAAFHEESARFHRMQADRHERGGWSSGAEQHSQAARHHGRAAADHASRGFADNRDEGKSERDGRLRGGRPDQYDDSERGSYRG